MNIFKFGRGDFFGVIIPGAFLVINFTFFVPAMKNIFYENTIAASLAGKEGLVTTLLFVLSYIIGFALRLLTPSFIEWLSIIIRFPYIIYRTLRETGPQQIGSSNPNIYQPQGGIIKRIKYKVSLYSERFPYINWFFDNYLEKTASSQSKFFFELLANEFGNNRTRMSGHHFINSCKLLVKQKSTALHDELIFFEGTIRFLSGMSYALGVCLLARLFFSATYSNYLLSLYCLLFVVFVWRLRHLRWAEVRSILSAYAFACRDIPQCPISSLTSSRREPAAPASSTTPPNT